MDTFKVSIQGDAKELDDNEFCDLLMGQLREQVLYFKRLGSLQGRLGDSTAYHEFRVRWKNVADFKRQLGQFDAELTRRLNSNLRNVDLPRDTTINSLTDSPPRR